MVRNSEKFELATYYRKRGFSYSEIAKICGISKATVSNWLAGKAFSKRIKSDNERKAARDNAKRINLLNKAKGAEREKRYTEAVKSAATEFKHYYRDPLFLAGLMLYLASGDRTDTSRIRLTSKEPQEHKLFIKFLLAYGGLEKTEIKHWVMVPEGTSELSVVATWSKQIGLTKSQFGKTQFLSHNKNRPLHIGTGNTIIASTVLKRKLNRWLELALKELK